MKDEIGMEQATSFNDSTKQVLQGLLDAANHARDTLDNAARGVYNQPSMGEPDMGGADMSATPDMGASPESGAVMPPRDGGDEDLATADSAAGGAAELGRGKRV